MSFSDRLRIRDSYSNEIVYTIILITKSFRLPSTKYIKKSHLLNFDKKKIPSIFWRKILEKKKKKVFFYIFWILKVRSTRKQWFRTVRKDWNDYIQMFVSRLFMFSTKNKNYISLCVKICFTLRL